MPDKLTLVLFGASWCAPCIIEVRAIDKIAAATAGEPVVLAWTDGGFERMRIPVPGNVQVAAGPRAQQLWQVHGHSAAGLPYSVMLDGSGRRCAHWTRPLTPEAVAAMRRTCRNS
jgi:thiol-disulfide isomerase/thioredoxin